jgi:hypothetical protein
VASTLSVVQIESWAALGDWNDVVSVSRSRKAAANPSNLAEWIAFEDERTPLLMPRIVAAGMRRSAQLIALHPALKLNARVFGAIFSVAGVFASWELTGGFR